MSTPAFRIGEPLAVARPHVPPPPRLLTRGDYRLCDGCSNGLHTKHVPVNCVCDLCTDPAVAS